MTTPNSSATPPETCLNAEALQQLAERATHDDASLELMDHVMSCVDCMAGYELLRAVRLAGESDTLVQPPADSPADFPAVRSPFRRFVAPVTTLLAASLVVFALTRSDDAVNGTPDVSTVRASSKAGVQFVSPATAAMRGDSLTLVWNSVPQSSAYEVELLSDAGELLATRTTSDTTVTLAPGVVPANVTVVEWLVVARRADGNATRSELLRVNVR